MTRSPKKLTWNVITLEILTVLAIALLVPARHARAETGNALDRLIKESRLKDTSSKDTPQKLMKSRWFAPNSNLYRIFALTGVPRSLLDILDPVHRGYLVTSNNELLATGYVEVTRVVAADTSKFQIALRILIPHPKYASQADLLLLPVFAKIRPPALKIERAEKLPVKGRDADYYESSSAGYLVIKCNKSSVVQVSAPASVTREELLRYAGQLDFDSLDQELGG